MTWILGDGIIPAPNLLLTCWDSFPLHAVVLVGSQKHHTGNSFTMRNLTFAVKNRQQRILDMNNMYMNNHKYVVEAEVLFLYV